MQCCSLQNGERGGKGGRKGEGGGNEMHCWEGAGRRSHDPCDVVGILMSPKFPSKRFEGRKCTEKCRRETHTQHTGTHTCTCTTSTRSPNSRARGDDEISRKPKGELSAKRDPLGFRHDDRNLDKTLVQQQFIQTHSLITEPEDILDMNMT